MKPSTSVLVERSSPPSYHSVLAAPTARARSSGFVSASARSLCGMVTLAPTKPCVERCMHEFCEALGRHRLDAVAALDAERAQPVMMDQRRARMRRRPSDQACGAGFGLAQASSLLKPRMRSVRRCSNRASRGGCQCYGELPGNGPHRRRAQPPDRATSQACALALPARRSDGSIVAFTPRPDARR